VNPRLKENLVGYALIAPFLLFFCVFLLGPFVYAFHLSFRATTIYSDWYNRLGTMTFVGVRNYTDLLFHDADFWWSMLMTLYYAVLTIPTSIALSLLLAVLLTSRMHFKGLFRTGFFLPQVLDLLVIGIIWMLLFSPQSGAIDRVIRALLGGLSVAQRSALTMALGLVLAAALAWLINAWLRARLLYEERFATEIGPKLIWLGLTVLLAVPLVLLARGFDGRVVQPYFSAQRVGLLDNRWTVLPVIALVVVLKGVGLGMILFLTTIQQIPASVYEAAEVDGANPGQKLFLITLPLVRPIILFLSITGLMAALNAFTEVYAMTFDRGGPPVDFLGQTVLSANLTGYYLWMNFRDQSYGIAAALSFILLAVALIVSLANVALLREREA
jgi:multiple sugar transport system permease protein